ncbi:SET domain-containing protein SmydA-8-like isoform X2 [Phymastichus coffea]|uniref:SET domain-containing protein SmydA-8-like isoform X2 n=1 Tax=Phymastichus coffea TaxID=108790 RepID=UPI00273A9895|nr:SET domain-containing protein SmydA-8-like isoform X2 [Phymastichus coffea]
MKPETEQNVCAVCKVSAKRKCGGCRSVYYCGKEHQKAHWREHWRKCKCYKLVENEKLGRHYVAVRRIEAGEIVIREEKPLVQGPQQDSVPVCLGCCVPLTSEIARPCEECGWPLCQSCTSHGDECEFTKKYKSSKVSISGFGLTHPTYKCVSVIRALALRDSDPAAYKKFTNLSSHHEQPSFGDPGEVTQFIKRFFDKLEDTSEEEIARAAGILLINGHEVPITEPSQIAVYDASSYLEHSCKANCAKSFTNSAGLIVRAALGIEKGGHITICYSDPLWGTANRRHYLLRTKFFECACERCSDPTELGTMFDALKCNRSDCRGNALPRTFLAAEVSDYLCDRCDNALSSRAVDELTERIGRELASIAKDDVAACRDFLKAHAGRLHENHFYMTDARLALAQLIGQQEGGLPALDAELLSEKILLCKKLDELMKTIVPSENRVRGLLLFEMHAAVAEFGRRRDKEQLLNILQESKRLLEEAYQLLKYEPDVLPEGKIAKTAKMNLMEMELLIKTLCANAVMPL